MIGKCEICGLEEKAIFWRCDKHYHCDGCNKKKSEVSLCFHSDGVWCPDCRKKHCEEIVANAPEEIDTSWTNDPVCPHCGYDEHMDTFEWGGSGEHTCSKCDRDFEYEMEVTPHWTTSKKGSD